MGAKIALVSLAVITAAACSTVPMLHDTVYPAGPGAVRDWWLAEGSGDLSAVSADAARLAADLRQGSDVRVTASDACGLSQDAALALADAPPAPLTAVWSGVMRRVASWPGSSLAEQVAYGNFTSSDAREFTAGVAPMTRSAQAALAALAVQVRQELGQTSQVSAST
jgi:hypothetical protein